MQSSEISLSSFAAALFSLSFVKVNVHYLLYFSYITYITIWKQEIRSRSVPAKFKSNNSMPETIFICFLCCLTVK